MDDAEIIQEAREAQGVESALEVIHTMFEEAKKRIEKEK